MITIKSIECEGGACPYQIEATTDGGEYFYLRYRGGRLRAGVAKDYNAFWDNLGRYNIINVQCGEDLDGWMTPELGEKYLKDKVVFPEGFRIESYPDK